MQVENLVFSSMKSSHQYPQEFVKRFGDEEIKLSSNAVGVEVADP